MIQNTFDEKKYWKINLLLWEIYIFVYIWHKENFQILPHGLCWLKHYAANLYQSRRPTSDNWSLNKSKLGMFYPKTTKTKEWRYRRLWWPLASWTRMRRSLTVRFLERGPIVTDRWCMQMKRRKLFYIAFFIFIFFFFFLFYFKSFLVIEPPILLIYCSLRLSLLESPPSISTLSWTLALGSMRKWSNEPANQSFTFYHKKIIIKEIKVLTLTFERYK